LRQWRNECDYRDAIEGDLPAMATSALVEAARVINDLPPPVSKP